ncbi:MAG: GlxA family transcriptional regulator [Rhodospirillales bacterium]|jgi:AraC family transcriptional regulator, glycine betaine-responsive activator|nr:GlxA family transcriptional regulator [Rhodospirillales bacterium]
MNYIVNLDAPHISGAIEPVTVDRSVKTRRVGFVLVPQFSMIAYASAIEALRHANYVSERTVYEYVTCSMDGEGVKASNDVTLQVDASLADAGKLDMVVVCSGWNVKNYVTRELLAQLRRLVTHGAHAGAICTGSYILARAGLLDGYRCTIHWENLSSFSEEFPKIEVVPELYEIDRTRYTCAGGTAAIDLMLHMISSHAGHKVATAAADQLIHHRIREGNEGQRMALRSRLGVSHPKLLAVISDMEENLENPVNCTELAKNVGLSTRQLERLFNKYLGLAPTRYYLKLRMDRSRFLLLQTSLSVLDVALACGFISASHFSKCYREHFNRTPSEERHNVLSMERSIAG